ncbi:interferon lambda-4-like [Diceros bicornis minor]|uniref:interferon lambda-4-like n=1 Tax=Diceros bicornis minor TaxID=77932 RepID=UPI0026ECCAF5|nr:interferon lambda-4-like [Diceros bicornis minor]
MGQSGAAAVSAGLWVLVTVGVAADPRAAAPRRCLLSHYRSLDPGALAAVKALRDRYVSDAQTLRPGPWARRARRRRALSRGALRTRRPAGAGLVYGSRAPLQADSAARRGAGLGKASAGCISAAITPPESPVVQSTTSITAPAAAVPVQGSPTSQPFRSPGEEARPHPTLVPQEEETLSRRPRLCSLRPSGSPRAGGEARARAALSHSRSPHSCARLRLVARGIADAQAVLSNLRGPERVPGTGPTLELLAAAARDVAACLELVRPGSWRKSLRPPRRRPNARRAEWSQGEADSPRCHEATVIFTLLRLLTWDLRLVAHAGPCV